jgi:AcrR family transcriptional regulator
MPKDTFFNLPGDKRALICDVAISEFARYSYDAASINRIVEKTGIAKGSFYQYFEDKKDLFLYLMQLVSMEKAKYIAPVMQNPEDHDIFILLRELYIAGIKFAGENPKYAEIGNRLIMHKDEPIYQEIFADSMPAAYDFFETLLEKAIERGDVRADIDVKMFTYMIASMNALVVQYYAADTAKPFEVEMMVGIDEFIEFLKSGIGSTESIVTETDQEHSVRSFEGETV